MRGKIYSAFVVAVVCTASSALLRPLVIRSKGALSNTRRALFHPPAQRTATTGRRRHHRPHATGFSYGFTRKVAPLRMSEPSDTSSDAFYEYVDVEIQETTPTTDEALVLNVLDLIPEDRRAGVGFSSGITEEARAAINEALYKLEALHSRTPEPAVSPLLNGVWQLRYVGGYASQWALPSPTRQLALFLYSGGYSPGIFALGLAQGLPRPLIDAGGDVEITISRSQPRVEASAKVKFLGGAESSVKVQCRLEVQSDVRLRETYESFSVLDQPSVAIPEALQYSRDLYVTYLDEDLLVVRDASGVPEVLTRKDKTFRNNWGNEPSSFQDMGPPGEE